MISNTFRLWGTLIGFLFPAGVFTLFHILAYLGVEFGKYLLGELLMFTIAIIEIPPIAMARKLNLPAETGAPAFMFANLTSFGYILVIVFWTGVGLLIGFVFDKMLQTR